MKVMKLRVMACLLVLFLVGCVRPVTRDVVVSGSQPWTDTGFDLVPGQKVSVQARGEVFANATLSGDPDGIPGRPELAVYNLVPEAQHVALVGRIGEHGPAFLVGAQTSFVVEVDGRLYLGPNDKNVGNNRGEFVATVTVR